MGAFMTALLILLPGQAPDDMVYTNQFKHRIPFNIQAERRQEIREVRLFVSTDKGTSWQQYSTEVPNKDFFVFDATRDGEYWFRIAAVNLKGGQEPEDIYKVPVQMTQKMIIDSLRPVVKLVSAQRQGDDVTASWEVTEDHPDPATLALEYQTRGSSNWVSVPLKAGPTGEARFRPGTTAALSLRMTFRDRAGNQAQAQSELPDSGITTTAFAAPVTPPTNPAVNPNPQVAALPGTPAVTPPPAPTPTPASANSALKPAPAPAQSPAQSPGQSPALATNSGEGRPSPPPAAEPAPRVPPAIDAVTKNATTQPGSAGLVASSEGPAVPAHEPAADRSLPPQRYINESKVNLEYEITREGPSRVGRVDLWWTPDEGRTWRLAPPPKSPDGKIVEDRIVEGRHQRTIALLEGDLVYGFSLVLHSRAGLSKAAPRPGDAPEMRIELDTQKPVAKLFKPQPDPHNRDTLILTWSASDKNLTPAPITLEWSEGKEGPWRPIGTDLVNTGQYAWQLPPSIPVQVYLRLRVKDLAGNEGVAVTAEPQLMDLTEPEGRLVNVTLSNPR